jgi:CRISPR/Cas system endoribonuclease Cas6 (RAMP superfamily)
MRLLGKEYKKFPYPIIGEIVSKELHFKELSRYSNRQKTDMKLGGITGEMKLKNLSIETYNILKVGELIGVGKSTVFGLGKIKIKPELGGSCE